MQIICLKIILDDTFIDDSEASDEEDNDELEIYPGSSRSTFSINVIIILCEALKNEYKARDPVEGFEDEIYRIINNLEDKQNSLDDMEESENSEECFMC